MQGRLGVKYFIPRLIPSGVWGFKKEYPDLKVVTRLKLSQPQFKTKCISDTKRFWNLGTPFLLISPLKSTMAQDGIMW